MVAANAVLEKLLTFLCFDKAINVNRIRWICLVIMFFQLLNSYRRNERAKVKIFENLSRLTYSIEARLDPEHMKKIMKSVIKKSRQ